MLTAYIKPAREYFMLPPLQKMLPLSALMSRMHSQKHRPRSKASTSGPTKPFAYDRPTKDDCPFHPVMSSPPCQLSKDILKPHAGGKSMPRRSSRDTNSLTLSMSCVFIPAPLTESVSFSIVKLMILLRLCKPNGCTASLLT